MGIESAGNSSRFAPPTAEDLSRQAARAEKRDTEKVYNAVWDYVLGSEDSPLSAARIRQRMKNASSWVKNLENGDENLRDFKSFNHPLSKAGLLSALQNLSSHPSVKSALDEKTATKIETGIQTVTAHYVESAQKIVQNVTETEEMAMRQARGILL